MTDVRLTYTVTSDVKLLPVAQRHILDVYHQVRDGFILEDDAPPGFAAAVGKLYDDASDTLILHTVVGEIVAHSIKQDVPSYYPKPSYGFYPSAVQVAYQDTPARLDPPSKAQPMLIFIGSKAVH